jgi:hypothetical protein
MVVIEGVLQSTPSRLGLLDAVIEVLELAGGDVAAVWRSRMPTQDA